MPLQEAFSIADEILRQGIMGISEIIAKPGLINVDFADVRSVMQVRAHTHAALTRSCSIILIHLPRQTTRI